MATNQGGPKQQQITKNNRIEKQQISNFRKQHISKIKTNETNIKFQKTTDLKKQQFSKNIIFKKNNELKKNQISKKPISKNLYFFWNLLLVL